MCLCLLPAEEALVSLGWQRAEGAGDAAPPDLLVKPRDAEGGGGGSDNSGGSGGGSWRVWLNFGKLGRDGAHIKVRLPAGASRLPNTWKPMGRVPGAAAQLLHCRCCMHNPPLARLTCTCEVSTTRPTLCRVPPPSCCSNGWQCGR